MKLHTMLAAFILGTILVAGPSSADDLTNGFIQPPDSARPWVYWFIMDGNLSREGITADFEAMKEAGIGGMVLMEVNVGIPRGSVEFMSDEWCDLFAHAVREAERLGLAITLNAGPGWTGSGGPWVKAEQSMQHLVASAVEVTGPTQFDDILPRPEPRPPYFGESGLPEWIKQAREAFYADVAVLAVPHASPRIADIDEKALYVREPYTSKPGIKPYLPAPASYDDLPDDAIIPEADIVDLTDRLQPDGRLTWEVPEGEWTILRFGRRNTGANTRPAPEPGLGFESDKFDPAALDAHFDAFVGRLLDAVGPRPNDRTTGWTMLHIDSWEMGSQNWTDGFEKEFRARRGYDPMPYLPVMTGRVVESLEVSERFLWDLRLTAQELVLENHAEHLKALGREHGFGLSIEPYDMNPTSDMALGGVADVPMCEFWSHGFGFDSTFSCIESTSIGHTLGRPIVAAEAFTAGSEEAWQLYPAAMKNQGDWAFATGINRIVFHRYAHQPWLDRRPGMTMGPYGVHWDRTQTWWPMVSAYHEYVARCQFMLRQGAPVADICYLVPEGAPHVFRPPADALEGELRDRRGHNFDGCTPQTLIDHATVQDGKIVFPGGAAYAVLVLPTVDTMTPALLRKIKNLVESGASIIGNPPEKSPSLSEYPQCDGDVQTLALEIWGSSDVPEKPAIHNVEAGRVIWGEDFKLTADPETFPPLYPDYEATAEVLHAMGVSPDFESDGPIRYTHRRAGEDDIYFVANCSAETVNTRSSFRVTGRIPQCWDPVIGAIRDMPDFTEEGWGTSLPLCFAPYQSFFIVFRDNSAGPEDAALLGNCPGTTLVANVEGPWDVVFDPALGGPGPVQFDALEDWSTRLEPGIKHYSGIATYRTTFNYSEADYALPRTVYLDLGVVHSMARVRLNGNDVGVVWCAPWRVEITRDLKSGENALEVDVANLWPNRLIGDSALPEDEQISWTTWNPYKPDSPLLPSGLIGPVQIMAEDN
ncbi:MAG: hypothetical protein AMXMBFR82_23930 [Candidatus Hydrogenedentota bacterium]